ncbi:MAG: ankyrin repeat domain-containing protein [Micavibrio sp.]|nr:ankyrin repeat domain-containing protein [Micavibrio sp.]
MAPNDAQIRAFISAAWEGDTVHIRQFLSIFGPDYLDVTRGEPINWTALFWSAKSGQRDTVAALLDAGADVNRRDASGSTALIWAAGMGNDDVVALLLERGADMSVIDREGRTALGFALEGKKAATAKLLTDETARKAAAEKAAWEDAMRIFTNGTKRDIRTHKVKFRPK